MKKIEEMSKEEIIQKFRSFIDSDKGKQIRKEYLTELGWIFKN